MKQNYVTRLRKIEALNKQDLGALPACACHDKRGQWFWNGHTFGSLAELTRARLYAQQECGGIDTHPFVIIRITRQIEP